MMLSNRNSELKKLAKEQADGIAEGKFTPCTEVMEPSKVAADEFNDTVYEEAVSSASARFDALLAKTRNDRELAKRPAMATFNALLADAKHEAELDKRPALAAFNALLKEGNCEDNPTLCPAAAPAATAAVAFSTLLAQAKSDRELEKRPAMAVFDTLIADTKREERPAMAAFNALLAKGGDEEVGPK
jgi:hypothetical protein